MKIAIILNAKRTKESLLTQLKSNDLAEKYQLTYDLFVKEPEDIEAFLETLSPPSYNAYLVGGGDGTVRLVAKHLMNYSVPLAILPLGSFNLLAKSLGYSDNLDSLFAMIKNKKTKQIDIAEVNGNIIINHFWIGFYYRLLKEREKYSQLLGRSRILKSLFNLINLFKPLPIYNLAFKIDNKMIAYKTCLVFIGNNESLPNFFNFGEHKSLTTGLLSINILSCNTRKSLFMFLIHLLFYRNVKTSKYIQSFAADNVTISSPLFHIKSVIDGELFELQSPLCFMLHQKKLTVVIE